MWVKLPWFTHSFGLCFQVVASLPTQACSFIGTTYTGKDSSGLSIEDNSLLAENEVAMPNFKNSTSDDPDKISEKIFVYKQAAGKYALNFTLTQA